MQREEVLDLLLLEADGGLSMADAARLDEAVSKDPMLRDERARMHAAWGELRELGRAIALQPDFGEHRLAALRNPRREGVLIGGQVRAAAAALLFATLLRGAFEPRSSIVFERPGDPGAPNSGRIVGVIPSGSSITHDAGEAVNVASIDGLRCTMRTGAVELNADGVVRVEPGPADIDIEIGERTARIDLGDVVLYGANAVLHVSGEPFVARQFDVLSGSVRVGSFAGRTISRRDGKLELGSDGGLIAVAPFGGGASGGDPNSGATRKDTTPVVEPSPDDPIGNFTPTIVAARDFVSAHVFGTVTASSDGTPLSGATIRLTRDLLPDDSLATLLPTDPAARLEALRDLDVSRSVLGEPMTIVTEEDGTYDLPKVAPGTWRVDVLAPSKPVCSDLTGRFVEIAAGSEIKLDLGLDAGTTAIGRVTDRYGHTITGAMVDDGSRGVLTDKYGRFALHNVPTAGVRVFVHAEGFEDLDATLQTRDTNHISIDSATAIKGVIRDAAGNPLLGRIEAGFELDGIWRVERTNVERDGLFSLRTIPVGVPVRLVASASGHEIATSFLDVESDRSEQLQFDLATSSTVTVLPFDVGYGRPIDTATVLALAPEELVAGVEHPEEITLDGLDANTTNAAIAWAPGLRYTSFDIAPNVGVVHVDLQPARERHLHVVDDSGRDIADALVVWCARSGDSTRFLSVVSVVRTADGYELPDYGPGGGGLVAESVVLANGKTVVVVDDPTRDDTVVTVSSDD